jgi:hypothetical protein
MKRKLSDASDEESHSNTSDHDTHDPVDFEGLRVWMKWSPTPAVRLGYRSGMVLQGLGNGNDKQWAVDFDEYGSKVSGQPKKPSFWLRFGIYVHRLGSYESNTPCCCRGFPDIDVESNKCQFTSTEIHAGVKKYLNLKLKVPSSLLDCSLGSCVRST